MVTGRRQSALLGGACAWVLVSSLSCERGTYRDPLVSHDQLDAEAGAPGADASHADASHDAADGRGAADDSASEDAPTDDGTVEPAWDGGSDASDQADALEASTPDGELEAGSAPIDAAEAATLGIDLDARSDAVLAPPCPIRITDVTATFGERIAGRVVVSASVNPYTKLMTERIGARTTRDQLVMFERVAGSWSKTDISRGAMDYPRNGRRFLASSPRPRKSETSANRTTAPTSSFRRGRR